MTSTYILLLDMLGSAVFAISGVIVAGRAKMDPIGVIVLGVVTAIGGGTIRDVILKTPPVFWIADPTDLYIAIFTSLIAMGLLKIPHKLPKLTLPVLDAIGLAVFVGIGVNKAISAGAHDLIAVCMGVITGVGGGVIRDMLAREVPMVLRDDIYATACLIGGSVHVITYFYFALPLDEATTLGIITTLSIRLAAIHWRLKLPKFSL